MYSYIEPVQFPLKSGQSVKLKCAGKTGEVIVVCVSGGIFQNSPDCKMSK
jgi:hypothetical protein